MLLDTRSDGSTADLQHKNGNVPLTICGSTVITSHICYLKAFRHRLAPPLLSCQVNSLERGTGANLVSRRKWHEWVNVVCQNIISEPEVWRVVNYRAHSLVGAILPLAHLCT